ncbi:GGDEF domain-containing protein [Vibrio lentus]|uniref:Diguanylate cyclase n=1 Tax=Vibrio lentus TaxID=136468 RepID=A0AA44VWW0_9VIBR|nr:sensor domain-containing diguanylate cyclase [Vibrio lentus]MCB5357520.1 sensor domain-containing diguanylate cyclase [Vibrio lentus]MCB5447988.1 sensor domain-containing diguanylate cyclase [Vibrio lentus]MCB5459850.1 sensor domain-containing diguanylate cyclase [Vibrio lentus]MCC4794924.1 sensor domain-containing diguanylate cyclase [Vibrio lentus]MCC4851403.1 sensor domain-containing diguanylate cyclase [Vibrio lentus]
MEQKFLLEGHRAVNSLLRKLALGMDRKDLNHKIIQLTEQLFGQRMASILLLNSESKTLHLEYAPNLPDFYNQQIEGVRIGVGIGSCGEAAALKKAVMVSDINRHPNWVPFLPLTNQANLHACWSVPIISSHGHVLGTFAIYSQYISEPHEFELEILELLASLYSVALEKYELENQLNFFAHHDSLTHCLNRRALLSEAENVLAKRCFGDKVMACLFVDVDKFKSINDTYGHSFGDGVLLAVAKVLDEATSTCAKIGRYGGDEFVVFSCFDSEESVVSFYHSLERTLEQALYINDIQFAVSVGLSYEKDPESLETLIVQADKNMYQIKQAKSQR